MKIVSKRILSDESGRPVAVQMDYEEFLRLERAVEGIEPEDAHTQMMSVFGTVDWGEDGLEYQSRLRGEWD